MKRIGNPNLDVRLVKPRGPDDILRPNEIEHGFVYSSNADLSDTDALLLSNSSVLNNSIVSGVDTSMYENGMAAHPSLMFNADHRARMMSSDGWTQEMDAKLRVAHGLFGNDWIKVAQYIDVGQTNKQCCRRWCQYLDPAISTRRTDEWTEDENNTLIDILKEYRVINKTLKFTWSQVAKHIKTRTQVSCKKQYQQYIAPKTGPFSPSEDAALMQQASTAAAARRPDIEFWVNLEQVMQRPAESLCNRWSVLKAQEATGTIFPNTGSASSTSAAGGGAACGLHQNSDGDSSSDDDDDADEEFMASFGGSAAAAGLNYGAGESSGAGGQRRKKSPADWSAALDEELLAAYVTYNHDWNKISSNLSAKKSPKQCYQRWSRLSKAGGIGAGGAVGATGGWTEEQVNLLRDMATEQLGESTNSEGEPNGKIYWAVISKAVGHPYQDCRNKWRALKCPAFKKGFFTDEEDRIVINRVREWGNNGPGIWKVLEKELGRSEHSIYMGWNKRISKIAASQLNLNSTVNEAGGSQQPVITANTSNSSALFQSVAELSEKGGASSGAASGGLASNAVYTSSFLRGGHRGAKSSAHAAKSGKSKLFDDDSSEEEGNGEMQGHDLIPSVGRAANATGVAAATPEAELANVVSVLPRARPLKRSGSNNGGIWTPEMDARLREAHELFDKDFELISEYMENGQSARQCSLRWSLYVDPALVTRRRGDWTPEEINQLKDLTNSHLLRESQLFRVDWKTVATILNREQNDCKFKFKELFHSDLKTGPYTPEEDAIILQRVRETGDSTKFRPGFWAQVGKELNRSSSTVIFRWKKTLCRMLDSSSL